MEFVAGAGTTNIDLIFGGLKKLPKDGEEVFSNDFSLMLGGGIPASLINLSRLGIKTKIITQLGDDKFSSFAKHEINKYNTEINNVSIKSDMPLTLSAVAVLPNDRSFISYCGYDEPDDRMKEQFYKSAKGAKIVLMEYGGYLDVYKKLKEEGSILVFDTGWDDELSFEKYEKFLTLADYYTPNIKEALKITGESTPENAAKSLTNYFEKVIIKLDKNGCLGIENGSLFTIDSIKKYKAIDTTGAGDAFLSGFVYGIYNDFNFKESILLGNLTGGKSVTEYGALSAYLTEEELINEFNKNKNKLL